MYEYKGQKIEVYHAEKDYFDDECGYWTRPLSYHYTFNDRDRVCGNSFDVRALGKRVGMNDCTCEHHACYGCMISVDRYTHKAIIQKALDLGLLDGLLNELNLIPV